MIRRRAAPLIYAVAVPAAGLLRRALLPEEANRLFQEDPNLAMLFLTMNVASIVLCLYVRRYPAYQPRAEKPLAIAFGLFLLLLATAVPVNGPALVLSALAAGLAGWAAERINRPKPPPEAEPLADSQPNQGRASHPANAGLNPTIFRSILPASFLPRQSGAEPQERQPPGQH